MFVYWNFTIGDEWRRWHQITLSDVASLNWSKNKLGTFCTFKVGLEVNINNSIDTLNYWSEEERGED